MDNSIYLDICEVCRVHANSKRFLVFLWLVMSYYLTFPITFTSKPCIVKRVLIVSLVSYSQSSVPTDRRFSKNASGQRVRNSPSDYNEACVRKQV